MTGYEPMQPGSWGLAQDILGMHRNMACGFSFAEGHSQIKRWRHPRTFPPCMPASRTPFSSPNNQDSYWFQDYSSRRR
jgi:hypothetical protein